MRQKYFIKTFGCAQNVADSERISAYLKAKGMKKTDKISEANYVVINTCMVRESAENRVYGLVNNLKKISAQGGSASGKKIVLTGCMVGMAVKDNTGNFLKVLRKKMSVVDEFLPIEEIEFDYAALRTDNKHALVPISNGCNNFCTYCVVPYTRGREISRPMEEILRECQEIKDDGYQEVTLLGQNVNSYGADLIKKEKNYSLDGEKIRPVLVKHMGRYRIQTLFPYLLEKVAKMKFKKVDFLSSNPWDFSDELIKVIARNPNISRTIHLPVQSGSNSVLKRMNRWYTQNEYLELVEKLKTKIPAQSGSVSGEKNLKISTDIIVGFCGETEEEFQETVNLCQKVGFYKAYVAIYSDRPMTAAHKTLKNNVPFKEKKRRWQILEDLINKPNLIKKRYE